MLTVSPMSATFIDGTGIRKQPILVPGAENPLGFTPHRDKLRNLRLRGKPFSFKREDRRRKQRARFIFEGHPPELRARMLARLKERLDYWEGVRGKRPQPGEWLYARVICGIEHGFTRSPMRNQELASRLGMRGYRIGNLRKQIRNGKLRAGLQGFKRKREMSQGVRVSNTLGVV